MFRAKRKTRFTVRIYRLVLIVLATVAFSASADKPRVAIILDDIGYRATDNLAFELPTHVTFAILPHTEHSTRFANRADQQGRLVMLHLPMEALQPRKLGPGALMSNMNAKSITETLDLALLSVPNAVGVNNHMGSKLTQLTFPMTSLMTALSERQLFFIDSRTTRFSKAHKIASRLGLPALERKVFLDHQISEKFINEQFARLVRLARKYDQAIGIGHPHPLTIDTLSKLIANESSVEFVNVGQLMNPDFESQLIYSAGSPDSRDSESGNQSLHALSPAN